MQKMANGKNAQFEDELRSYVFLQVCEMDESRLIQLDYNEELIPFVSAIIKNQRNYKGLGVNRTFDYVPNRVNNEIKLQSGEAYLIDFLKDETPISNTIDINSALSKLDWREKQVIEAYVKYGSVSEVVENSMNSRTYIVKILNGARKKIKNELR